MRLSKKYRLDRSVPILTIFVVIGTIITYASSDLTSFLIYDRNLIIEGQYWRILTANFVHFDGRHLFFNLTSFMMIGVWLEQLNRNLFGLLLITMSLTISFFLLLAKPDLIYYGGLSAIGYGSCYFLALIGTGQSQPWKKLSLLFLILLPIKIISDVFLEERLLFADSPIRIVWESHAAAILFASFLFFIIKNRECRFKKPGTK